MDYCTKTKRLTFHAWWPDGRSAIVTCENHFKLYEILDAESDMTQCKVQLYDDDLCLIFEPNASVFKENKPQTHVKIDLPESSIGEDLGVLLKSGDFSDVKLSIDKLSIPCHKAILSSRCTYFHTMFSSQMVEKNQAEIQLLGMQDKIVEIVVNYIYTGNIETAYFESVMAKIEGADNFDSTVDKLMLLRDLLQAADFFDLSGLSKLVQYQLVERCEKLTVDKNCAEHVKLFGNIYEVAGQFGLSDLQGNIASYMPFDEMLHNIVLPEALQNQTSRSFLIRHRSPFYFGKNHELYQLLSVGDLSVASILRDLRHLEREGANSLDVYAGHALVRRACTKRLFEPEMDESIWQVLEHFLQKGYPIDSLDYLGKTMLHIAAIGSKEDFVLRLLNAGASPHQIDVNRRSIIDDVKLASDNEISFFIAVDLVMGMDLINALMTDPTQVLASLHQHKGLWTEASNILTMLEEHVRNTPEPLPDAEVMQPEPPVCLDKFDVTLDEHFVQEAAEVIMAQSYAATLEFVQKQQLNIPTCNAGSFRCNLQYRMMSQMYPKFMELLFSDPSFFAADVEEAKTTVKVMLMDDLATCKLHPSNQLCSLQQLHKFGVFAYVPPEMWIYRAFAKLSSRFDNIVLDVAQLLLATRRQDPSDNEENNAMNNDEEEEQD